MLPCIRADSEATLCGGLPFFHPPMQEATAVKPWRNASGCPPKPRRRRTCFGGFRRKLPRDHGRKAVGLHWFIFPACPVSSYRRIVLAKLWLLRGGRSLTENRGCLTSQARRGWLAFINPKDEFAGRALRSRQSSSGYAFIRLPRICAEPFHKDILEVQERQFGDCKL